MTNHIQVLRFRVGATSAALLLFAASCADGVTAPAGKVILQAAVANESTYVGEPGEFIAAEIRVQVLSAEGRPRSGVPIAWTTEGSGSTVTGQVASDQNGIAIAHWRLGTNAAIQYRLSAHVAFLGTHQDVEYSAVARPTRVATLRLRRDSVAAEVGDTLRVLVDASDPYGNQFTPDSVRLLALDTNRAAALPDGRLLVTARGRSRVEVRVGAAADTLAINGAQVVGGIAAADSILFPSLGEEFDLVARLVDRRGAPIPDSLPSVEIADSSVLRAVGPLRFRSLTEGSTSVRLVVGGVSREVHVKVRQRAVRVTVADRQLEVDAIGDTLPVMARAFDALGTALPAGRVSFRSQAPTIISVNDSGIVRAVANGTGSVLAVADSAVDTILVRVSQRTASIRAVPAALRLNSLGARAAVRAAAYDRNGNAVSGPLITMQVRDSSTAFAENDSTIIARSNGVTVAVLRSDTAVLELPIEVRQIPAMIVGTRDSINFDALAARDSQTFAVYDSLGSTITNAAIDAATGDASIAIIEGAVIVAAGNGRTSATFSSGPARLTVPVVVTQRAVALSVDESLFAAPRRVTIGETLDPKARAVDRLGSALPASRVVIVPDTAGVVDTITGACVTAVGSGWVDLRFSIDTIALTRRLRIYAAPELLERETSAIRLIGIPDTVNPWAPTLVSAPNGSTRLYFGGYKPSPSDNVDRADLDYLESTDGETFLYKGIALAHAPLVTDPYGWGIENVAIVSRNDSAGYRMYFAAGSTTLGWQVFSAVGDGVGPWTPEPGVRLPNGAGDHPEGEGMVVLPRADGGYRMIEGSMVVTGVASGSWQIVEYESSDQMSWTFRREHIAQGADGPGTARAVYSPTIIPFGRGVYRMFYTGDNLRVSPTPQSSMWSAISFDLESWQGEGTFIEASPDNVMYASALGNRVAYLLSPCGGCRGRLAIASIRQR